MAASGKYVFLLAPKASGPEVKKEVERVYKVKVARVNIINVKGKKRRTGRQVGRTSDRKKAIVTLVPGQTIEGLSEPS